MIRAGERPLRFGLNYTPSKKWYYNWNEWDPQAVRSDFDAMRSLGIDHIRVQVLWPYFQPNPGYISATHLGRLQELMAMAGDSGFDVLVTMLTGFLSGYFFLPPSVTRADVFTRESTIEAELRYIEAVAGAVMPFENLMGFDLGNEINCINHSLPAARGDAWAERVLGVLRPLCGDGILIVNGVDHSPWLFGSTFSPGHLANSYDAVSVHAWPYFSGCLEMGPLDHPASHYLSEFYCRLVQLYQRTNVPIWIQEFGASDPWGGIDERSTYMRRSVELALESGATMFTWWCSHDKSREVKFHEFEYHYGLFGFDNTPKPLAAVYRDLIADCLSHARTPAVPDCIIAIPDHFAPRKTRELPEASWMEQNRATTVWDLYEFYLRLVQEGKKPVFRWSAQITGDEPVQVHRYPF